MRFLNSILRQRWYPLAVQIPVALVFALIMVRLLFGARENNPGMALAWLLWWPLIPLTFLAMGRIWCSICPFGAIGDWFQKLFGLNRPAPRFIKNFKLWAINLLFFLITWYEVAYGLTDSAGATATLFLFVIASAVVLSLIFERRVWCRYLCPVGGIFGNYAQTAAIELRGNPKICADCSDLHCYNGRDGIPGCHLFISPRNLNSNRTCDLCGDCHKTCLNGAPTVYARPAPGIELWAHRQARLDEVALAAGLVGLISVSTLKMLGVWPALIDSIQATTGLGEVAAASLLFLIYTAGSVGIFGIGAYISARLSGEKINTNFTRFGYGLIPLNLATHLAHNMNHFLGEGRLLSRAAVALVYPPIQAAGVGGAWEHGAAGLLDQAYIRGLQYFLVGLGTLASFYVVRRILLATGLSEKVGWPHYTVIAFFGWLSFWLFSLPMIARH